MCHWQPLAMTITIDKNTYVIYNIFYNQGVFIMSNDNQKDNNKVSIKPFIILFLISIGIFAIIYICHSKNIENRFNNALQNYEKSMSAIFNNMVITNGNNENIYTNLSQTNNNIVINNNQLQNNSTENLKLSFEVGFKMLESSMNEIMKNSNDILQFWFAFLSVIMIVFTLTNNFINNSIFKQAKENLNDLQNKYKYFIKNINRKNKKALELIKNLEKEAKNSTDRIKTEAKNETNKLIEENNRIIITANLFNLYTQAYNVKDYNLSINYLTAIIKIYEDNFNNNKYDKNSDNYDKALKNCAMLYNHRGVSKAILKKYKEATEDYNKAIELNPNHSEAYNNIGNIKYDLRNINEAIEYYNEAIKLNPNFAEAFYNRGLAKYDLKDYEKAIKDYNKAIELNPNYSIAFYNRGLAKLELKENEEAIKDFNKAIELNNNYSYAYFNRGLVQLQLGKIEEAIKDFITAYELDNNDEIKEKSKNELINLAQKGYNEAREFCKKYNINYNDNKE